VRKEQATLDVQSMFGADEAFFFEGQPYTGTAYWQCNGFVGSEFEVRDGLKHGAEREFFGSGAVESLTNFEQGQEHGLGQYFYASGMLKEEIRFEIGSLIWSNTYDEAGLLTERFEIDTKSSDYRRLQLHKPHGAE
jgi:antitoxin component YwqK of YwqJK toxin-antitoxin module